MALTDWSTNPANNGVVAGVQYWPEGMLPGQVNDTGRQMMADVAVWLATPTFPNGFTGIVVYSGSNGRVALVSDSAGATGKVDFRDASNVSQGYIGAQSLGGTSGPITYQNNANTGHFFSGGQVSAVNGFATSGASNTIGLVDMSIGSATTTGAVEFRDKTTARQGIIGAQTTGGPINYHADTGAGHHFDGGPVITDNGIQIGNAFLRWDPASGRLKISISGTEYMSLGTDGIRTTGNVIGNTTT